MSKETVTTVTLTAYSTLSAEMTALSSASQFQMPAAANLIVFNKKPDSRRTVSSASNLKKKALSPFKPSISFKDGEIQVVR